METEEFTSEQSEVEHTIYICDEGDVGGKSVRPKNKGRAE